MHQGIITVCIAGLRKEANLNSNIITQLLFGETFTILNRKENWLQVECTHDNFVGWVDEKQMSPISQKQLDKILAKDMAYSFDTFFTGISKAQHIPIVLGSNLPIFDGLSFKLLDEKIIYNGQVVMHTDTTSTYPSIEKICLKYLNAPEMQGGRSPFGIDATGFVQMVYKFRGVDLPRTISGQLNWGRKITFLSEAHEGDLIFLLDDKGEEHVGIYLSGNRVAHCYGKVKIDAIDTHGVYDSHADAYTHKLNVILRP